jgi:hypothetical protein
VLDQEGLQPGVDECRKRGLEGADRPGRHLGKIGSARCRAVLLELVLDDSTSSSILQSQADRPLSELGLAAAGAIGPAAIVLARCRRLENAELRPHINTR